MAEIAEAHGGVIDKFVGDAVMVWFGGLGTSERKDDAMLRALLELNEELRNLGLQQPLAIRCGANSIRIEPCNLWRWPAAQSQIHTQPLLSRSLHLVAHLDLRAPIHD